MGKINVFLKRPFWEINWVHKEELTKLQFLSLFIHITFSIAVSLRKCLETLPGLTQKPVNMIYEGGLFRLFYGGSNSFPQPQPQLLHPYYSNLCSGFWDLHHLEQMHQLSTLSLPFLLTSSISSKDWTGLLLWFGGRFFQFPLTPTQALAIALWSSLWVDQCCLS